MKKPRPADQAIACTSLSSEIAIAADGPAKSIQLIPMGVSTPKNGKPAKVVLRDRAHAEAVVASSIARLGSSDMMVDYDHQSVFAANPQVGGRAAASGWIKSLRVADDGIWGDVEWTASASAQLTAREYRYISPYFLHRPDGTVTGIINAALTNTPNLDLAAVASALGAQDSTEEDEDDMNLKAIASALGLAEDADEAAILAAIGKVNAKATAFAATATALGVTIADDGDLSAVATAAAAAKSGEVDPKKYVSIEVVDELKASVASMQTQLDGEAAKRMTALMDEAGKDGRLSPGMRKHVETFYKDEASLASFLATLPKTKLGQQQLHGDPDANEGQLTDEQKATCSMLGVSEEDYLKTLKGDK